LNYSCQASSLPRPTTVSCGPNPDPRSHCTIHDPSLTTNVEMLLRGLTPLRFTSSSTGFSCSCRVRPESCEGETTFVGEDDAGTTHQRGIYAAISHCFPLPTSFALSIFTPLLRPNIKQYRGFFVALSFFTFCSLVRANNTTEAELQALNRGLPPCSVSRAFSMYLKLLTGAAI